MRYNQSKGLVNTNGKKKLLFLGAPFDYYKGGAEYQYKVLEKHLKKIYDIFYLFRHPTNLNNSNYLNYNYKIRKHYNSHLYTDSHVIYRLIKKLSPDIIYKRGVNYISAIGVYYANKHNIKMVVHIGSQKDVDKSKQFSGIRSIFDFMDHNVAKYVIKNAGIIICQAEYQDLLLQSNYKKKCNLILPNFHPAPENIINKRLPIKILWIANFKPLKQPELFIKLAGYFQDKLNVRFIMIGRPATNSWQDGILEKIGNVPNLDYKGELSINDVNELLRESHGLVNTSRFEGLSNTFIQAWMRKVPVISLNSDPDDMIKNNGIGFHSGTFEQMVLDVKTLIENETVREMMAEKCQKFALRTFSVENVNKFYNLLN